MFAEKNIMTFKKAVAHLIKNFNSYDMDFKNKWKPYITKYRKYEKGAGTSVSDNKMRQILKEAGYRGVLSENWELPKK